MQCFHPRKTRTRKFSHIFSSGENTHSKSFHPKYLSNLSYGLTLKTKEKAHQSALELAVLNSRNNCQIVAKTAGCRLSEVPVNIEIQSEAGFESKYVRSHHQFRLMDLGSVEESSSSSKSKWAFQEPQEIEVSAELISYYRLVLNKNEMSPEPGWGGTEQYPACESNNNNNGWGL